MKFIGGSIYAFVILPIYVVVFTIYTGTLVELVKYSFDAGIDFGNKLVSLF